VARFATRDLDTVGTQYAESHPVARAEDRSSAMEESSKKEVDGPVLAVNVGLFVKEERRDEFLACIQANQEVRGMRSGL
jgi:hypothetical protein